MKDVDYVNEQIGYSGETHTNPVKAIRAKCVDCCCGSINEVRDCAICDCSLFPFRFGKNPYRDSRKMTPEEVEAARRRLNPDLEQM